MLYLRWPEGRVSLGCQTIVGALDSPFFSIMSGLLRKGSMALAEILGIALCSLLCTCTRGKVSHCQICLLGVSSIFLIFTYVQRTACTIQMDHVTGIIQCGSLMVSLFKPQIWAISMDPRKTWRKCPTAYPLSPQCGYPVHCGEF